MDQIKLQAFGKINIALDVTGKRPDGYHEVKMILKSVQTHDDVVLRKQESGITLKTNKPFLPTDERNLAYKAAALIMERYGIAEGVRIDIGKNIPIAAGMAGGSTDGAACIRGMNELFGLNMDIAEMDEIAVKLGADVPFCLRGGTYLAEGIGEKLTEIESFPACYALMINPGFGISTKWAYEQVDLHPEIPHPDVDGCVRAIRNGNLHELSSFMGNVLEEVAKNDYPQIQEIEDRLMGSGAIAAMMSGSGPTVFGIFDNEDCLERSLLGFGGDRYGKFKSQLR